MLWVDKEKQGSVYGAGKLYTLYMAERIHTRVEECPECGGVLMGAGPMGNTRDFRCLSCGHETRKRHSKGTYIEREIPDDYDGYGIEKFSTGVPDDVDFDEFLSEYVAPKYQK